MSAYPRRVVGAVLVLLVVLPAYRLLASPDAGPFILGAIDAAELSRTLLITGTLIIVAIGVLGSRMLAPSSPENFVMRLGADLWGERTKFQQMEGTRAQQIQSEILC